MTEARKITKTQWMTSVRHGYASVSNGQRYILTLDHTTQATMLAPVEVVGMRAPATEVAA